MVAHVWNQHLAGTMRMTDANSRTAGAAEQEKREKQNSTETMRQPTSTQWHKYSN